MVKFSSPNNPLVINPLLPNRRMIESVSEKGGEMTGRVASAVTSFLPRRLVRETKSEHEATWRWISWQSRHRAGLSRTTLRDTGDRSDFLPDREREAPLMHESQAQGFEERIGDKNQEDQEDDYEGREWSASQFGKSLLKTLWHNRKAKRKKRRMTLKSSSLQTKDLRRKRIV